MSLSRNQKIAGAVVGGALVLAGGGAWAATDAGSPARPGVTAAAPTTVAGGNPVGPAGQTPAANAGKGAGRRLQRLRALAARADRGTVTVKDQNGSWIDVSFARGPVKAASATSVTVTPPDGKGDVTVTVTASTKLFGVSSADKLTVGQPAVVVYDAGGGARSIVQPRRPANAAAPANG